MFTIGVRKPRDGCSNLPIVRTYLLTIDDLQLAGPVSNAEYKASTSLQRSQLRCICLSSMIYVSLDRLGSNAEQKVSMLVAVDLGVEVDT